MGGEEEDNLLWNKELDKKEDSEVLSLEERIRRDELKSEFKKSHILRKLIGTQNIEPFS